MRRTAVLASVVLCGLAAVAACVGDQSSGSTGDSGAPDVDATFSDGGLSADTSTEPDGTGSLDASDSATPACDLNKPFGPPTLTPGAINTSAEESAIWFLPDQLTVFVSSNRWNDGGYPNYFYTGTRTSLDASFGSLAPMTSLNGVASGYGLNPPAVTADGKTIYFGNGVGGAYTTWVATRSSTLVDFDPPLLMPAPVNVEAGSPEDFVTWVTPDGSRMYLVSNRTGSNGRDIWVADRAGAGGFNAPTPLASVNSAAAENGIILTPDELQAFLRRGSTLFYASRSTKAAGFSPPVAVTELGDAVSPSWVSPDGCTLYFESNTIDGGAGSFDMYSATRGK